MSCLARQGAEVGLVNKTSCEFFKMCTHFGAVKVVHSKSSDKHESSLTLRVALNKSWHRLIHWWLGRYLQ